MVERHWHCLIPSKYTQSSFSINTLKETFLSKYSVLKTNTAPSSLLSPSHVRLFELNKLFLFSLLLLLLLLLLPPVVLLVPPSLPPLLSGVQLFPLLLFPPSAPVEVWLSLLLILYHFFISITPPETLIIKY